MPAEDQITQSSVQLFQKEMATHSRILAWEIPWKKSLAGMVHGVAESQT